MLIWMQESDQSQSISLMNDYYLNRSDLTNSSIQQWIMHSYHKKKATILIRTSICLQLTFSRSEEDNDSPVTLNNFSLIYLIYDLRTSCMPIANQDDRGLRFSVTWHIRSILMQMMHTYTYMCNPITKFLCSSWVASKFLMVVVIHLRYRHSCHCSSAYRFFFCAYFRMHMIHPCRKSTNATDTTRHDTLRCQWFRWSFGVFGFLILRHSFSNIVGKKAEGITIRAKQS